MLFAFCLIVLGAYVVAASRAVRHGRAALLRSFSMAVLLLVAGVGLLGWWYAVPSTFRLTVYILGFAGPAIVVPTALLWIRRTRERPPTAPLATALAGASIGLVLGVFVVVFWPGLW